MESSISNKQDVLGLHGILNSGKVDKKKKYEDQFRGTAKLASIDRELEKLRDKLNISSASDTGDSNSNTYMSTSSTSKNSKRSR
jgi:hypothetical protein